MIATIEIHPWAKALTKAFENRASRLLGLKGSALSKALAEYRKGENTPLLIVAPDPERAADIHGDILYFLGDSSPAPLFWPAWDILPFETDHPDVEIAAAQVTALRACLENPEPIWIVTSITALLQPTLSPKIIKAGGLSAQAGNEVSPENLIAHLVEAGLEPVQAVDAPGQFSRRGGILDVFPLLGDVPYRLEFFGDEIDTIRKFDPGTQRSEAPLSGSVILADVSRDAFRQIDGSDYSLLDYISEDAAVLVWHPERITRVSGLYADGFDGGPLFTFDSVAERLSRRILAIAPDLDSDSWPDPPWIQPSRPFEIDLGANGWERLSGGFETALNELSILANKNVRIRIICHNEGEESRLRKLLMEKRPTLLEKADITQGKLSRGFIREEEGGGEAFVPDHELFSRNTPVRVSRKRFSGAPIADFAELREGDYVVHVANGIARFEGIQTLDQNGAEQDFLTLRFAEDARIYVPLSHIDLVQRYIGLGESRPQLSRLGSSAWSRKKEAVEKAVRDIAQDLLATQAKRLASQGIALPHDDQLIDEFDASFPYDETPDQLAAIEDIRRDQQSSAPMERLLCGDVGFGKTEMAVRAAFRAVNAGYQAAILVPTTILAEQHFRTFSQRMTDYPVKVACLSRFRGASEQKRIVEALKEGRIDVVVGTHRILSQDVGFQNLGLVVIDEEQKFGVEAKEKLKRFRADVDILTMTATPIPRTLHMSLLGLRDISNLTTAPRERHSVKTMVVRWSKEVVRRAILRELSRGGQCFFLHNRVHNIDEMAGALQKLVPEARFGVGHGQMAEGELVEIMQAFLDGKLDVLVCTTIIESGVDIPSVNTLFVNEADHFGLSELHQLRGRVGRYKHQAYAYFLVPEKRPISPEATKRLQALQEYTELGAGFRIAMRDLEIRGAGNLLGIEQSGHIHMIGFDLYCRLLERAVAAQKGEPPPEENTAELDLGTRAYIPPEYIPSEQQRIEFYRRLTRVRDMPDLEATRSYVRDRYGPPPPAVERCFKDQELRIRMIGVGLEAIGRIDSALAVTFHERFVRKGVMHLRHGGMRISPLRKNQWRIEISGVESSVEPGIQAAGMAERILSVLEAGQEAKGRKRRTLPDEPDSQQTGFPSIASVLKKQQKGAVASEQTTSTLDNEPEVMEYFSSDMLVHDTNASPDVASRNGRSPHTPKPLKKPAVTTPSALKAKESASHVELVSEQNATTQPEPKSTEPVKKRKKKVGKSGALAKPTLRSVLLAQREEATEGGVRKSALILPQAPKKPGIIAVGKPDEQAKANVAKFKKAAKAKGGEPKGAAVFPDGGARVYAVEPFIGKGEIGVVVWERAFNPIRSETMTLLFGEKGSGGKHLLRCVGMTAGPNGRVSLRLACKSGEETERIVEEYLTSGSAILYDGIKAL